MWWCFMNSVVSVASNIRTSASDVLLRKVSMVRMYNSLVGLFADRTANNTPTNLFDNGDGVKRTLRYMHCLSLNDERTIAFHQGWKQSSDVFDEDRQIWIDANIDVERDDLFIPRDDAV